MNLEERCKSNVWRKGLGLLACVDGVGHWARHHNGKGETWFTAEADCEHRWDWLRVCGGWGEGGEIEVRCDNCTSYFSFDIKDRYGTKSNSPDARRHFNEQAQKNAKNAKKEKVKA